MRATSSVLGKGRDMGNHRAVLADVYSDDSPFTEHSGIRHGVEEDR